VITFGIASFEEFPTPLLLRGAAGTVHSEFWFSEKLRLLRCGRIIEKRLETAQHPWTYEGKKTSSFIEEQLIVRGPFWGHYVRVRTGTKTSITS
jgi:hypothetical protein